MSASQNPAGTSRSGEYIVVARRYRPQNFDQLLGQQQATRALTNAIETNRVGHAYLFTGARGVGKTSAARIFSKALNCVTGPTATPCDECDICQSIAAGSDVDVLEIDGASNRGIDEIRQLRSNVNVRPSRTRFKIYIIDEVHMLTKEAFNALLKTLEEPPDHVKFIFCTTDPEKIPITVLSRCQRFDFAPVQKAVIVQRLSEIVTAEGATADPAALELLARRAAGSMRDSQSLLEQLLAFGGSNVTVDGVHALLGTADAGIVAAIAEALLSRDAAGALQRLDESLQGGVDVGQLTEQLLGYVRDVMAATVGAPAELMRHASPSDVEQLKATGQTWGLETILAAAQIIDQALARMRQSVDRRTLVETALVRISHLEDLESISQILAAGGNITQAATTRAGSAKRETRSATSAMPAPGKKKPNADSRRIEGVSSPVAAAPSVPESPLPSMEITADNAATVWHTVIDQINGLDAEAARACESVQLESSDRLVVSFAKAFNAERCGRQERKTQLEQLLSRITGRQLRIDFRVTAENDTNAAAGSRQKSQHAMIREAMTHPLIQDAMALFDADVTRVVEKQRPSKTQ